MSRYFEIEHIKPSSTRTERFVAMLQLAEKEDVCEKSHLIELQNRIVDPRFCGSDYRKVLSDEEVARTEQAIQSSYGTSMQPETTK